jgi:hypothetical protein
MTVTRALKRGHHKLFYRAERTMNHITVEANVVEIEVRALQYSAAKQIEDAISELNSSQLALVGGGSGAILVD